MMLTKLWLGPMQILKTGQIHHVLAKYQVQYHNDVNKIVVIPNANAENRLNLPDSSGTVWVGYPRIACY